MVQYQGGAAQTLSGEPAVPGMIPGGVASRPIPVRQLYRGWCHQSSLFIAGRSFSCLHNTGGSFTRTNVLVEASVSTACRRQSRDCEGVFGIAAWQNAVLGADDSLAGWSRLCPAPWVAWIGDQERQLLAGQRQWLAVCLGERCGAAAGRQSQASLYKLPQPLCGDQSYA